MYADFESEDVQEKLSDLETLIGTCSGCDSNWVISGSTSSWLTSFKDWVKRENCTDSFYACVSQWEEGEEGSIFSSKLA